MSGEAHVQGLPFSAIVDRFGTPVFVYDTEAMVTSYGRLRGALPECIDIFYSLKANPNISVCAFLGALGAGAEVASYGELVTALRAGVGVDDIVFTGPGKSVDELVSCVGAGLHAVVCESVQELNMLNHLAEMRGVAVQVLLRVNLGVEVVGAGLAMGGRQRHFGIDVDVLKASARTIASFRHVRVVGFHCYLGTRFLNHADVVRNTREVLIAVEELAHYLETPLATVDVGGGLGVAYFENEPEFDVEALGAELETVVGPFVSRHPDCRIIMETGRYLTATAGTYVVEVRYVKRSGDDQYVVVDGGINHYMSAAGSGSVVRRNFPVSVLNRHGESATRRYTVVGPLCTPADIVARRAALPEVSPGDLIGVSRSGAYGPTASPGLFIGHGYPAEVMVHRGGAHLIRVRDNVEDLLSKQKLIDFEPGTLAGRSDAETTVGLSDDGARRPSIRVGVDVCRIGELDRLTLHPRLLRFVYSEEELAYGRSAGAERGREFLCGRFAAKEAVLKLLGVGLFNGVAPREIVVERTAVGSPTILLTGQASTVADHLGIRQVDVSIAHKQDTVLAIAVGYGKREDRTLVAARTTERAATRSGPGWPRGTTASATQSPPSGGGDAASEPDITATVRMRVGPNDVSYGSNIVGAAFVLKLFGDLMTEITIKTDGDEGLLTAYSEVRFSDVVHPGDYIEANARLVRCHRLRRIVALEARKVIASDYGQDGSRARPLPQPALVSTAVGTCVASHVKATWLGRGESKKDPDTPS